MDVKLFVETDTNKYELRNPMVPICEGFATKTFVNIYCSDIKKLQFLCSNRYLLKPSYTCPRLCTKMGTNLGRPQQIPYRFRSAVGFLPPGRIYQINAVSVGHICYVQEGILKQICPEYSSRVVVRYQTVSGTETLVRSNPCTLFGTTLLTPLRVTP
jgi:hypothetical protein